MKALVIKVELGRIPKYLHLLSFISGFWALYLVEGSLPQKLSVSKVISVPDSLKNLSLECPSRSPNSTLLWILHDAHVVISSAGANVDNHNKFSFIKSTGELQINEVSWDTAGIYRCVVQLPSPDKLESSSNKLERYVYDTSAVELRVRESYSNSWDAKYKNLLRGLMAAGAALLIFAISCTVHSFRWRKPESCKLNEHFSSSSENMNICDGGLKWESNQGMSALSAVDDIPFGSNIENFSRKQRAYNTKVFVIPDPPPFHIENIKTSQIHGLRGNFSTKEGASPMMMLKTLNSELEYGEDAKAKKASNIVSLSDSTTAEQQGCHNFTTTFSNYDWQKVWAHHRNSTDTDGNTTAPIASPESGSSVITAESESGKNTIIHADSEG